MLSHKWLKLKVGIIIIANIPCFDCCSDLLAFFQKTRHYMYTHTKQVSSEATCTPLMDTVTIPCRSSARAISIGPGVTPVAQIQTRFGDNGGLLPTLLRCSGLETSKPLKYVILDGFSQISTLRAQAQAK